MFRIEAQTLRGLVWGQPNPLPTESGDQRGVTGAPTAMAAIVQVALPFAVN